MIQSSPRTGLSNDDGRSLFALSVPRNSQIHQLVYFRFSWAGGSLETTLRVVSGSAKKGAKFFPGVSTRHLTSSGAGNYRQKNCDDFANFLGTLMLLATDDVNGKRALGAGNSREIHHERLIGKEAVQN